jgi:heptosyltransferase-2
MSDPRKIVVVQPSWVGDAVMATPMLRALRARYPDAHISYLAKRYVKPIFNGMPWADQILTYRTGKARGKTGKGRLLDLAARVRTGHFDMAILLTNSFKAALLCKMAKIPRTVGYDRDGRGFLLSDKLLPVKDRGKFIPTPIVKYYLGLTQYLGSQDRNLKLELFATQQDRRAAAEILERAGLDSTLEHPAQGGQPPLIILNPGAQSSAKCWLPENFARLGDRFIEEMGATVLLSGSPRERSILNAVQQHMTHAAIDLSRHGLTLGALKEIVRRCDLMVTNDTGPRHIAAAFDVPVVTLFGPTLPEWTEIYFEKERKVAVKVFCGPCQRKTCPLDHRCMTRITPAMVFDAAGKLVASCQLPVASKAN